MMRTITMKMDVWINNPQIVGPPPLEVENPILVLIPSLISKARLDAKMANRNPNRKEAHSFCDPVGFCQLGFSSPICVRLKRLSKRHDSLTLGAFSISGLADKTVKSPEQRERICRSISSGSRTPRSYSQA